MQEIISTDPLIYWPDPMDTLSLPHVSGFSSSPLRAPEVAFLLQSWLVGCRGQIDVMGEAQWVRFVATHLPSGGFVRYGDVEDFARVYIYRQVRSGVRALDGREVPLSGDCFSRVAVDFGWSVRAD
jgi:hypothetical protein